LSETDGKRPCSGDLRRTLFRSRWTYPRHLLDHLCLGMGCPWEPAKAAQAGFGQGAPCRCIEGGRAQAQAV